MFALNDLQLRKEFGSLAEQRSAPASKALLKAYYGHGPQLAYFGGCSDDGREALRLAERFPSTSTAPSLMRRPTSVRRPMASSSRG